jgi:hypothetical protein
MSETFGDWVININSFSPFPFQLFFPAASFFLCLSPTKLIEYRCRWLRWDARYKTFCGRTSSPKKVLTREY